MKPLRILQVGKFYPPPFGGMETVLFNLIQELSKDAHVDVVVANTRNRNESFRLGESRIWKLRSLGSFAGTSFCPTMPWVFWRLLRKERYDIVHLHLPNPTAHLALQWIIPGNTRLVVTWHSDIVRQKRLVKLYLPFLHRFLMNASAITAATPKNFESFPQLRTGRYPEKLHALPFGIDVDAFAQTGPVLARTAEIHSRYGGDIVFACGRHIYYKGFEYLIRAMLHVPKGVLLLGGRGPMSLELEGLARELGCADRIHFLGFIPQDEIAAYYHAASVVAMPSVDRSEAFGMVQLEAMACNKPIVCCELHNGVTFVNLHGITGLVVEPRNPAQLAEALNSLLADAGLRDRMGRAGHDRVSKEFSLKVMRERHLRLFADLTQGRATRPEYTRHSLAIMP